MRQIWSPGIVEKGAHGHFHGLLKLHNIGSVLDNIPSGVYHNRHDKALYMGTYSGHILPVIRHMLGHGKTVAAHIGVRLACKS